jgi:hypothetical protein
MKPIVANKLNAENVNVALVRATRLKSQDCIQIQDKSITYSDNLLPALTGAIETNSTAAGALSFPNATTDVMVTNQSLYLYEEGRRVPLWYQYTASERYYNASSRLGNITFSDVSEGEEYIFVPQTSIELVARNTVKVEWDNVGSWVTIPSTLYVLDLGRRSIILTSDTYDEETIRVSFYAVNHDIAIVDQDGNDLAADKFGIILDRYKTYPGASDEFAENSSNPLLNDMYLCTVYLSETPAIGETLTVKYRTIDENNVTEEREEIINPLSIYERISAFTTAETRNDMKFVVGTDYAITTKLTDHDTIFVKQVATRNSKIGLLEPQDILHDQLWFIEIAAQDTVIDGETYSLLEEDAFLRTNGLIVKEHTEVARMLTAGKIKTKYNNILSTKNGSGFSGISIQTSGTDLTSYISDIDSKNGIVYLTGEFPFDHLNTTITYRTLHKYVPYDALCVNAYRIFDQISEYVVDKYAVLYMLPTAELKPEMGRSVFHISVYKHPELVFEAVPSYKETVDGAIDHIVGADGSGVSNLYSLIPEYIASGAGDTLHPIVLGVATVTSPVTASSLEFIDIRRRGGGMPEYETYLEHLSAEIRHNLDIAHWNQFEYNLDNIAVVRIPRTILDDLVIRMGRYDTELIRLLRADPTYDVVKHADAFIRKQITKYLRAGCHFSVEYV